MEIKLSKRQTGKTTKIVELVREDPNGILIVMTTNEERRIRETFGLNSSKVKTIFGIISTPGIIKRTTNVYVDEVGCCLNGLLHGRFIFGTHSNEDMTWQDHFE